MTGSAEKPDVIRDKPDMVKWSEQHLDWADNPMPLADKLGYHRAHVGRSINGTNVRARTIFLGFGQKGPPHVNYMEVIVFQLDGETEFIVGENRERFHLTRYDALFIPSATLYEYSNVGQTDVRFLSIVGRVGEWPDHTTYNLPGETKPLQGERDPAVW